MRSGGGAGENMFWRSVLIRAKFSERKAWPLRPLAAALGLEADFDAALPLADPAGALRAWGEGVVLKARWAVIAESLVVARRGVVVCIVRRLKSAGRELDEAIVVDGRLWLYSKKLWLRRRFASRDRLVEGNGYQLSRHVISIERVARFKLGGSLVVVVFVVS